MSLDKGKAVVLVFLDMSAAFDTVNDRILLSRLSESFGIKGKALEWFNSYLTNMKQFVAINNAVSCLWDQNVGVPEGMNVGMLECQSVIGPILYLL